MTTATTATILTTRAPVRLLLGLALLPALACRGGVRDAAAVEVPDGRGVASGTQPGVGPKYGSRDPRTCPDRTAPARGTPSAAQAAQYVQCEREGPYGSQGRITLLENVRVQVGGGRPYQHVQDSFEDIDPRQPVYPIRGSFTDYGCDPVRTPRELANGYADNRAKNCDALEQPRATGVCYKTTFADWHCNMVDTHADVVRDTKRGVAPPR